MSTLPGGSSSPKVVAVGGGHGLAIGRAILQEPSPAAAAKELAEVVHAG